MRRLLPLLLAACSVPDVFTCATDDQCVRAGVAGRCEAVSACSFPDSTCPSARRFGDFAPSGLSGECVAPGNGGVDGGGGGTIDAGPGEIDVTAPDVGDTSLDKNAPTLNYGGATELGVDSNHVALVRFDTSGLSGTVSTVELHVWTGTTGGLERGELQVFELLEDWAEGTGNGQAGQASWNDRLQDTPWTAPGAGPGSRGTTVLASASPSADATEYVLALAPAQLQRWIDEPEKNFGLALVVTGAAARELALVSREGQTGRAPFLHARIQQ